MKRCPKFRNQQPEVMSAGQDRVEKVGRSSGARVAATNGGFLFLPRLMLGRRGIKVPPCGPDTLRCAPAGLGLSASPNSSLFVSGFDDVRWQTVGRGERTRSRATLQWLGSLTSSGQPPRALGSLARRTARIPQEREPQILTPLHFTNHVYLNSSAVCLALPGKALENWTHQLF